MTSFDRVRGRRVSSGVCGRPVGNRAGGPCVVSHFRGWGQRRRRQVASLPGLDAQGAQVFEPSRAIHQDIPAGAPRTARRMRRPTHSTGADNAYVMKIENSIVGGSMAISTKNTGTITM